MLFRLITFLVNNTASEHMADVKQIEVEDCERTPCFIDVGRTYRLGITAMSRE